MNPFGGDRPQFFPRARGGPGHGKNGPRRHRPRHPALVRLPLRAFQRLSINTTATTTTTTTTTTNNNSDIQHHNTGALQPITRFYHPQDANTQDGPSLSAFLNFTIQDILRHLQSIPNNIRDEVFWDICHKVLDYFKRHHLPSELHWINNIHARFSQSELVLYKTVNGYQHDFEEQKKLGQGGYGRVVAAYKCMDDTVYAVKIINMDKMDEAAIDGCRREVMTLAKLNHPRVVRYFNAWIELKEVHPIPRQWASATVREHGSDASESSSAESSSENSESSPSSASDSSVMFQDSGGGKAGKAQTRHAGLQENDRPIESLVPWEPWVLGFKLRKVLYIQMEQCGESLRKWLDDRNESVSSEVDEEKCFRILYQVAEALCYVHQQGYMHRDVKPANVLFTLDGNNVKLGDFGLACLLQHPSHSTAKTSPPNSHESNIYTADVGTPFYIAPEVKQGKYGEKSDMYSLGIIQVELFMPFKTYSERHNVISKLKTTGEVNSELKERWPRIAYWIEKLVDANPANRPSAKELLESSLFHQPPPSSPTTTTTGEAVAGALSHQEFTQSEFMTIRSIKINNSKTETIVSNRTVRFKERVSEDKLEEHVSKDELEEHVSKDELIAELKEENYALKREVETLKRNLSKIGNAAQADEY